MTTDNPSATARKTPSVHVVRARKLLIGGLIGGLIGTVVSLVLFGILFGPAGAGSAVLAAVMVLFFYAVGQLVMVKFADAGARMLLMVAMLSYTARVVVLGLILLIFNSQRDHLPALNPLAVFVTTILVVAGWLVVEVLVFSRLRINAFDTEYVDRDGGTSAGPEESRAEVASGGDNGDRRP